jgi:ABC-type lipoprotein export system ATPase subunit
MEITSPLLEVRDLSKSFSNNGISTTVLSSISLKIYPGEFIAIMGKSGAGKSTLLYQISMLDIPTEGDLLYRGESLLRLSENDKTRFRLEMFGFVFQDYALFPELTTLENIALPLMMRGTSQSDAYAEAYSILEKLSLASQAEKLPSQMSGGQQQRVSIARALVGHPEILFADEPTANLDSSSSDDVMRLLEKEHREGRTIVLVTHEPEYATAATRVIQLSDGVIISDIQKESGKSL